MAKIITFGEIMMRLSTPNNKKFIQTEKFDICFGGGEANVAVSLANYGHNAEFVTKVPDNPLGECAIASLRKMNVDTKNIVKGGQRLGVYYLESGGANRASNVVYDRKNSSIATASIDDFDFDKIFEGCDWFHFSGITPAISKEAALITKKACISAKKANVKVSCDLNYRKKLWTKPEARRTMKELMKYVDVCIGGREDAVKMLGFKPKNKDKLSEEIDYAEFEDIFKQMIDTYNFEYVICSLRESYNASDNGWSGCIYSRDAKELYYTKKYRITPIIDRVGAGDSFAGGVICGLLDGKNFKEALEFGVGASTLKHSIPGDFNLVSREEVDDFLAGDGTGRVLR